MNSYASDVIDHEEQTRHVRVPFQERLVKRYGPNIIKDLNLLTSKPFLTLQDIAKKYGISREYMRVIFNKFHGMKYTVFLKEKLLIRQQERDNMKCVIHPNEKQIVYDQTADNIKKNIESQVELLKKCKELHLEVKFEKNKHNKKASPYTVFIINGKRVLAKSAANISQDKTRYLSYYHINWGRNKRQNFDFTICYIQPIKTFYIIPKDFLPESSKSIYIRNGEPRRILKKQRNVAEEIEQYREAWHLLIGDET